MTAHVLLSPAGGAHYVRPGQHKAACGVQPHGRDIDHWRVKPERLWTVASRRCSQCIACLDAGFGPGKETA